MPTPDYIVIDLDIEDNTNPLDASMYGPFDSYGKATDYGNRNMQFFTINELWEPDTDAL